jgi:hypothetical protein
MTGHGVLCGCDVCWTTYSLIDDESDAKAIARAAEWDEPAD